MQDASVCQKTILNGLQGKGAHTSARNILEGITWKLTGEKPADLPHSIWKILNHLIYWQNFLLQILNGENPTSPLHAEDSWPGQDSPESEDEWTTAVETFLTGIRTAESAALANLEQQALFDTSHSRAELFGMLITHNSYHLGQIVLLRRLLASWPPPSGGDTW